MSSFHKKRVCVLATGGTLEKEYDEATGTLTNRSSRLHDVLGKLSLHGVDVEIRALMNKDSLEMTDADRALIVAEVQDLARRCAGIVIVHGTDRLTITGEELVRRLGELPVPVVLTGAMRPFELFDTDAVQNLTESLLAVQLLEAGVYVCMHNRVIRFPGVVKDYERRTFVLAGEIEPGARG
jgi:L-asparaginase